MGHALFENQIGEIAVAEQLRLLTAKPENFENEPGVIVLAARRTRVGCMPELFANGPVIEVCHRWNIAGSLQGEPPAFPALRFRAQPCAPNVAGPRVCFRLRSPSRRRWSRREHSRRTLSSLWQELRPVLR